MAHPNEEILRSGYEAFAKGDLPAVMSVFDEDAVWHSPGRSLLAGEFKGHQQLQDFFVKVFELSGGTFTQEVHDIVANDEHALVIVRGHAERQGKTLDQDAFHVWHLRDGKATETWVLPEDLYAADDFWS